MKLKTIALLTGAVALASAAHAQVTRSPSNSVGDFFTSLSPSLTPSIITRNAGNDIDQIQWLPIGSATPTHAIACIEENVNCLTGTCSVPFQFGDKLNPGVQRIELATGAVHTLVRGMQICDGIRTTPWGTVIATEEDFATDVGAVYEILDPMSSDTYTILQRNNANVAATIVDQNNADASNRIVKRTSMPVIRYEGLVVHETGVVLAGDEERPGSYSPGDTDGGAIFKFIPATLRAPAAGNITDLSQSPLVAGTNYALGTSCTSGFQAGQGCEIGSGRWRALAPVNAATGSATGTPRIGRESADAAQAVGYYRPEDMHEDPLYSDPLNPNAVRFCFANTGEAGSRNYGEVQCAIDTAITTAPASNSVTINRFIEGNPQLNQPDNLEFHPTNGSLYVIEDNPTGDVWACLPDGVDTDIKSDGCVLVFKLSSTSAEPTGFIFHPNGNEAVFAIQHSNDAAMPLFDDYTTDDFVRLTGFGATSGAVDFGSRQEALLKRQSQQLLGITPAP